MNETDTQTGTDAVSTQGQTPPNAEGTTTTASPDASLLASTVDPGQAPPAPPAERPEWMPEKFWTEKGPDTEKLAKSYSGLEQLLGKKAHALVPINEKSTPEEVAAWRKAMGVPETADGYQLKPEALPDGISFDENAAKRAAALAHKHHIPAAAMKELMAFDIERQSQMHAAAMTMAVKELEAGKEALKRSFGESYDGNIALAQRAVATVGGKADSRGFSDPEVVKVVVSLAKKLSDDTLVAGDSLGPSSSKSRAKDVMTNPDNPMHRRYLEGDPETVDQVRRMLAG
jgi:hypothetical protein